ncbi:5-dehydro-4-deoxy-D-glucuronate isomerase [Bengtsoniella intestinalis]|uniref:5-dehydro-4-deoxy-D-glucuronate isomerase n=1 Tax=Bengtsoniella intestinalis TaxID=3073143 RepID=UPI00391F9E8D
MNVYYANHPDEVKRYTTEELRHHFLVEQVFVEDDIQLSYSHVDRIIFGGVYPVSKALRLEAGDELRAKYFLERRELGIFNVGSGTGTVTVDGTVYELTPKAGMYVGKGNEEIIFAASEAGAKFYIVSTPAHHTYPTRLISYADAVHKELGEEASMNHRMLNQYIHPDVLETCQLSMGMTELMEGNGFNTMPSHTHERRMEVYFYFDMEEDTRVFHMMGQPTQTRHIIMKNEEAVISPSWSIHSGIGSKRYTFIWAMCGENQDFDDMDHLAMSDLR